MVSDKISSWDAASSPGNYQWLTGLSVKIKLTLAFYWCNFIWEFGW